MVTGWSHNKNGARCALGHLLLVMRQCGLAELRVEFSDAELHAAPEVFDGRRIRCVDSF